jgi:hypothetical protein
VGINVRCKAEGTDLSLERLPAMEDNSLTDMEPDEHQRAIESLLLDGYTHLWIADEFFFHIQAVLEHTPLEYLRRLLEIDFVWLAPERFLGRVTQLGRPLANDTFVIFLSPELLTYPTEEIRTTIAHELAHLVLGHKETPSSNARQEAEEDERQADDLAKSWGFNCLPNKYPL